MIDPSFCFHYTVLAECIKYRCVCCLFCQLQLENRFIVKCNHLNQVTRFQKFSIYSFWETIATNGSARIDFHVNFCYILTSNYKDIIIIIMSKLL